MNNTVIALKYLALSVHFAFISCLWLIRSSGVLSTALSHLGLVSKNLSWFVHFKVLS